MDKPNFNIVDKYFSAIPGIYDFDLPNSISITENQLLTIVIRIPRQILKCKYGFEIPITSSQRARAIPNRVGPFSNEVAAIKIKSSNGIDTFTSNFLEESSLDFQVNNSAPGYVEFRLRFDPESNYIDICSLSYSISFDTFKLNTLYSGCCTDHKRKHKCRHPDDRIKLDVETFLVLANRRPR